MPIIDDKRGVLVIRVVYDGPPMSGKTTSLRTLARGLGVQVTTPEERDGRTLFFDWIDYIGGLFEGRQIRCQIVSVPGQAELGHRRRELLASADAIVLVADTSAGELPKSFEVLRELLPYCRSQLPPVGIVLQANKRDVADSVPLAELQAELAAIAPVAVVETVATEGDRIREAFVFAVRLALDRVRAFASDLPVGHPEIEDPGQLLDRLKALATGTDAADETPADETPAAEHEVAPATLEQPQLEDFEASTEAEPTVRFSTTLVPQRFEGDPALDEEVDLRSTVRSAVQPVVFFNEKVFVPDPHMPGGFIWPPVDGRVALHEVASQGVAPVRTSKGDWWASSNGCLFHSAARAIFHDSDSGRRALIEWARLHATNARRLSPGRTVILADAGATRFRLWQLVRVELALRETLTTSVTESSPQQVARDFFDAANHLLQARANLHSDELRLPITLWTISGNLQAHARFIGLMPEVECQASDEPRGETLIARELTPLVRTFAQLRPDFQQFVDAVLHLRDRRADTAALALAEVTLAERVTSAPAGRRDSSLDWS